MLSFSSSRVLRASAPSELSSLAVPKRSEDPGASFRSFRQLLKPGNANPSSSKQRLGSHRAPEPERSRSRSPVPDAAAAATTPAAPFFRPLNAAQVSNLRPRPSLSQDSEKGFADKRVPTLTGA